MGDREWADEGEGDKEGRMREREREGGKGEIERGGGEEIESRCGGGQREKLISIKRVIWMRKEGTKLIDEKEENKRQKTERKVKRNNEERYLEGNKRNFL